MSRVVGAGTPAVVARLVTGSKVVPTGKVLPRVSDFVPVYSAIRREKLVKQDVLSASVGAVLIALLSCAMRAP